MFQQILYNWLIVVGLFHCVLGIVFIFISKTSLMDAYFFHLYEIFDLNYLSSVNSSGVFEDNAVKIDQLVRSAFQFLGPTIASWGLLFSLVIYNYRKQGTYKEKAAIIISISVWYLFDTGLSLNQNIYSHVYLNTAVFILLVVPCLLLKNRKESEQATH